MKRNLGVWLIILVPAIVVLSIDLYLLYKNRAQSYSGNPWNGILGSYSFLLFSMLYPLIIAIFSQSVYDVEYRNNCFTQLFTLPVKRSKLFFAKILYMVEILFISLSLAYAIFLILGYIFSYIQPQLGFQDYDVRMAVFVFFGKCFWGALAIAFIQFFFSLLFKKMIFPIGIACCFMMLSLIIYQWRYIDFIPYITMSKAYEDFGDEIIMLIKKPECINIVYIMFFLALSYWKFTDTKA
jgi:hypothetical protein